MDTYYSDGKHMRQKAKFEGRSELYWFVQVLKVSCALDILQCLSKTAVQYTENRPFSHAFGFEHSGNSALPV